ncbi:APC family permease [Rhodococcus opacus]|uniref:Putative amino acid transporter n=1 Tax=Rhodococcus opacus (strain B4) TaxID=632772 RepID=C1BDU3_RHOOB|nr:APC family permease [Rhodococcus opacus]BAH47146.1 putative amino acid transporter [Rhodococcus opacus B4]
MDTSENLGPSTAPTNIAGEGETSFRSSLGVGSIVFMVVAAAAPLGVVAATFPVIISVEQSIGAPLFLLMVTALLTVFAVGYTAMSRYVPNAGAFYSYIQAGLGRIIGTGCATLAYVSYLMLLVGSTTYLGVNASNAGRIFLHIDLPWWTWCLIAFALAGYLGYRNVDLSARVLGLVLVLEAAIVIVVDTAIILQGGEEGLSAEPFSPSMLTQGAPGLGFMFAFLCFLGFEATAVFRNEAKDPVRTIPRATYIAVIGIGLFYTVTMWCVIMGIGPSRAVAVTGDDPTVAVLNLASEYVGPIARDVMLVLLVSSQFACTLAFHNVLTRYQYTMGTKGVIPRSLGRISPKHHAPSRSSAVISLITVVSMMMIVALGLDPISEAFTWLSGAATLGIIIMMTTTGIAVIRFFRHHPTSDGTWTTLIAPAVSSIGMVVVLVIAIQNFGLLVGENTAAEVALGVILAVAFAAGVIIAVTMRRYRPAHYESLERDSDKTQQQSKTTNL